MEISKLKEEVKRLEGELRGWDQGIEALTKRADLIDQVISLEAEAITARDFLKEAKLSRGEDIANVVDSLKEFAALLKKDYDTKFNAGVEVIFYNI